jgi:hypothetical protein
MTSVIGFPLDDGSTARLSPSAQAAQGAERETNRQSARLDKGYRCVRAGYGYYTFEVDTYQAFIHTIAPLFVDTKLNTASTSVDERQQFVWRGMADPSWTLQSSLSRFASRTVKSTSDDWGKVVSDMTTTHLIEFLNQLRGLGLLTRQHDKLHADLRDGLRRSDSFLTLLDAMNDEQANLLHELFALGQHHSLLTPFLDWTSIPLVALYFAFELFDERKDGVGDRVVFALNRTAVEKMAPNPNDPTALRFRESIAHDNPRVVPQAGLFTFSPDHQPVDEWVVRTCRNRSATQVPFLIRFLIRNLDRKGCLEELAATGIHARTVFPDRFGAAINSNFRLESFADKYQRRQR